MIQEALARLAMLAPIPQAGLLVAGYQVPQMLLISHEAYFGPIPGSGEGQPHQYLGQQLHLVGRKPARATKRTETPQTKVISTPFEEGCLEIRGHDPLQVRYVFVKELVLKIDGVGGDDDVPTVGRGVMDGGQEVCQRFPGSCPGFHQQVLSVVEGSHHRTQHVDLLRAILKARELTGDESIRGEHL